MDPLQFAYQPNISVDDALIYMLQRAYTHLDTPDATVRITFFDFSSAFNTIQPQLLGEKVWSPTTGTLVCSLTVSWTGRVIWRRFTGGRVECIS